MALMNMKNELKNFDWNDLANIETIGVWPGAVKFVIVVLVFVISLGLGYWFDIRGLQDSLQSASAEETTLRTQFEQKAFLAANLEEYKEQIVEMEESFSELLRQLPSQTEVPDLVDDITETGLGSGLSFSNIELDQELAQEFYIEQPMEVDVVGNYHDFGTFVSGVASLPRIVTLHDFSITTGEARNQLDMTITARTYRYRSAAEEASEQSNAQ